MKEQGGEHMGEEERTGIFREGFAGQKEGMMSSLRMNSGEESDVPCALGRERGRGKWEEFLERGDIFI